MSTQAEMGRAQFGRETRVQRSVFPVGQRVRLADSFVKACLVPDDIAKVNGVVTSVLSNRFVRIRWDDGCEGGSAITNIEPEGRSGMDHTPYRLE